MEDVKGCREKDVEGEEGIEATEGFQPMEVNTWLVLTSPIKSAC